MCFCRLVGSFGSPGEEWEEEEKEEEEKRRTAPSASLRRGPPRETFDIPRKKNRRRIEWAFVSFHLPLKKGRPKTSRAERLEWMYSRVAQV